MISQTSKRKQIMINKTEIERFKKIEKIKIDNRNYSAIN